MKRRNFAKLTALSSLTGFFPIQTFSKSLNNESDIKISLAQWSLNKSIKSGELPILDFAKKARSFDINAIEYVASLYTEHSDVLKRMSMNSLAKELLKRSDDFGIDNFLFMIDGQGDLASSRKRIRLEAIENHKRWIDFSYKLGCKTMRVNLRGEDNLERWTENSVQSLSVLSNYNKDINVVVENHGDLSSNGQYLANVMSKVNIDNCGTLPDFGNFRIQEDEWYDRYLGVRELMPFAKAVSAKSHEFDKNGNETGTDYYKMMKIVLDAGYHGYVGIEYEGTVHSEMEGIRLTLELLKKIRDTMS